MKYVYAGSNATVAFSLTPPSDSGLVTFSVRGNAGQPLTSGSLTLGVFANTAIVTVPAAINGKLLPTETRFVSVSWLSGGQTYTADDFYVLADFLPLRVTARDVRSVIGANEAEIADAEVDLISAAATVSADLTPLVFSAALTAGDRKTTAANRMVVLQAALAFVTSLPLRIAQSMGNDQSQFSRLKSVDVEKVLASIRTEYEQMTDIVKDIPDDKIVQLDLFGLSSHGIDTIRGPARCLNFPLSSPYFRA